MTSLSELGRPRSALGDTPALPDRVALLLRDRILSGDLRPDDPLRVERLAEELGVSQTPVREALQSLRADDMVRALPRRGYVVAPLTRADVVDLFDVQAHLTGELAARAAGMARPADLEIVRARSAEVAALADAPGSSGAPGSPGVRGRTEAPGSPDVDGLTLARAEHELHSAINRVAAARKLAWLAGCAGRYLPPRFFTTSVAWRSAAVRSHVELVTALETADADGARAAMTRHVLDGRDLLLAHLDALDLWTP